MSGPSIPERVRLCHDLIDEAIAIHKPIAVFGMFSGGDDSTTATHIAAQHPAFTAAVHINTGIGIPETRNYVRTTCRKQGWPLREYRAKEDCNQDYRELVLREGFPGPAYHRKMYICLKERPLRLLLKDAKRGHKRRDCVLLISGCRSQESQRRMGNTRPILKIGSQIWNAVIHDWSKRDCLDYLEWAGVERNPVVKLIHKSGECLCGAFATPGELAELALWYPKTAAYIHQLETEVVAAGHNWKWEERPPRKGKVKTSGPLCWNCEVLELPFGNSKS